MQTILWKQTLRLWLFGFTKVPLIFWARPKVLALDKEQSIIQIPLRRRCKNHLHSMYFGVLCVGADIAAGLHLLQLPPGEFKKLGLVFKDFKAEFLKRPYADVQFRCASGQAIEATIARAKLSHEREHTVVEVIATTPSVSGDERVARFELTLSVKVRGS